MNIAFIGQKGIPARSGGVEHHVQELATRLAAQGHRITVYARHSYTKKTMRTYKGVRIMYLPSIATKHLDTITHTFFATLHALFGRYDVVHYHSIGPTSLSWMVRLFRPDVRVVSTFHCKDYEHKKWGWFARMYLKFGEYLTCRVPHHTITVSQHLTSYVSTTYGRDARYIPNGSQVHPVRSTKALSAYQLNKEGYILTVSRLIKHKGLHYLIDSFKQLKDAQTVPSYMKLVIVGEGAYTDEYVRSLHSLAQGRRDILFLGEQHGNVLHELFSNAYLFVQPSFSEGLSIALLEAMGYGRAVLVSNIPENIEAIGLAGEVFICQHIDSLREKLAFLMNNPARVIQLGKEAKERVRKYFRWEMIVAQTLAAYRNLPTKPVKAFSRFAIKID